jgi:CheY-like chemotaxis protein
MTEALPQVKVLIVDCNSDDLDFIAEELELSTYEVSTTMNAIEAISLIEDNFYDIIIIELLMPKMDGFTFIKKLHEIKCPSHIIAITAGSPSHNIDNCKFMAEKIGISGFLTKPFINEDLLEIVDSLSGRETAAFFDEEENTEDFYDETEDQPSYSNEHEDSDGNERKLEVISLQETEIKNEDTIYVRDLSLESHENKVADNILVISYMQLIHLIKNSDTDILSDKEKWILNHISHKDKQETTH